MPKYALLLPLALLLPACAADVAAPQPTTVDSPSATAASSQFFDLVVDDTGASGFSVLVLADGSRFTSELEYQDQFPALLAKATSEGREIRLLLGEHLAAGLNEARLSDSSPETTPTALSPRDVSFKPISVGNYMITGGCKTHSYVAGCIQKDIPNCALRLTTNPPSGSGKLLFDLHLAVWKSGPQTCFGMYESGLWKLVNYCPPCLSWGGIIFAYGDIRTKVYNTLLAAGVSASVALVLSQAGTPVLVAGATAAAF